MPGDAGRPILGHGWPGLGLCQGLSFARILGRKEEFSTAGSGSICSPARLPEQTTGLPSRAVCNELHLSNPDRGFHAAACATSVSAIVYTVADAKKSSRKHEKKQTDNPIPSQHVSGHVASKFCSHSSRATRPAHTPACLQASITSVANRLFGRPTGSPAAQSAFLFELAEGQR